MVITGTAGLGDGGTSMRSGLPCWRRLAWVKMFELSAAAITTGDAGTGLFGKIGSLTNTSGFGLGRLEGPG